jgi:F-type H+-transporting ATPase subunit a
MNINMLTENQIISQFEITTPLDQFEIRDLLSFNMPILNNLHLSLTNIGLYLTLAVFFALTLSILATNYNKIVSNN